MAAVEECPALDPAALPHDPPSSGENDDGGGVREGEEAEQEDNMWLVELEVALSEGCDAAALRSISRNRAVPSALRPTFWQVCLNVAGKGDQLGGFDELFDLPEQALIRADCQALVDKLGNEEEEKLSVASDLESLLTLYCKSRDTRYERESGWTELLQPMLALNYTKAQLYNTFYAIHTRFIPRDCLKNGKPFHLFRLLLLYHDPELCGFLDTKRISPDLYAQSWFSTLFAAQCDLRVILNMWDVYFQHSDQFLVFFLALVIVVNARDQLLVMESASKQEIIDKMYVFPSALEAEDIEDFCSLALYYASKTPQSFRQDYQTLLFGTTLASLKLGGGSEEQQQQLSQALCLSVSVDELLLANQLSLTDGVRYFLVDCRPADQYNAGHLPTAFHLDANLMLQNPHEFSTAVAALLQTQARAVSAGALAGGDHLCFMGSGREQEDQYVFMVVAHFLQRRTLYVSSCRGGYAAIHEALEDDLIIGLAEHQPRWCIVCNPAAGDLTAANGGVDMHGNRLHSQSEPSLSDKFEKLSHVVKSTSAIVKEKMINYIKNEQGAATERHVSSEDRVGKRYRNMANVFTIGDEEPSGDSGSSSEEESKPSVELESWCKQPAVRHHFDCQAFGRSGVMHSSRLCVTDTHLVVLRIDPSGGAGENPPAGAARLYAERPLASILKITSKKHNPELITFRYGNQLPGKGLTVTGSDRFLIPRAGEATKAIKQQIMKVLESASSPDT